MNEMDIRMRRQLFAAEQNVEGLSYADMRADRETRRQINDNLDRESSEIRTKIKALKSRKFSNGFTRAGNKFTQRVEKGLNQRVISRSITKRSRPLTLNLRRGVV